MTSFSVFAKKVCTVIVDTKISINWSGTLIDDCKKNDVLDVLIVNAYYDLVVNYPTKLIARYCDYNKSIVIDKTKFKNEKFVSFTCVKRK